jgi:hypothetical protein
MTAATAIRRIETARRTGDLLAERMILDGLDEATRDRVERALFLRQMERAIELGMVRISEAEQIVEGRFGRAAALRWSSSYIRRIRRAQLRRWEEEWPSWYCRHDTPLGWTCRICGRPSYCD